MQDMEQAFKTEMKEVFLHSEDVFDVHIIIYSRANKRKSEDLNEPEVVNVKEEECDDQLLIELAGRELDEKRIKVESEQKVDILEHKVRLGNSVSPFMGSAGSYVADEPKTRATSLTLHLADSDGGKYCFISKLTGNFLYRLSTGSEATSKPKAAQTPKTPPPKCTDCKQFLDDADLKYFQGDPDDALEEPEMLTNERLSLFEGTNDEGFESYDDLPQHKVTFF
eukprot:g41403.t1